MGGALQVAYEPSPLMAALTGEAPIKIRCSSLSEIMTKPRESGQLLSVGAKTHVKDLAKQFVYGYSQVVTTKYMEKGLAVENEAIALLNDVLFSCFTKNTEYRENQWISGTSDIVVAVAGGRRKIHDVKASWSLDTFPVTVKDAESKEYEWQQRGYMMLWDADSAEVDYCMVDTPEHLIRWEDPGAHRVSHIDPALRVTRVEYERDTKLEDEICARATAAQIHFNEVVESIYALHKPWLNAGAVA